MLAGRVPSVIIGRNWGDALTRFFRAAIIKVFICLPLPLRVTVTVTPAVSAMTNRGGVEDSCTLTRPKVKWWNRLKPSNGRGNAGLTGLRPAVCWSDGCGGRVCSGEICGRSGGGGRTGRSRRRRGPAGSVRSRRARRDLSPGQT